jgi:hypothetical protein
MRLAYAVLRHTLGRDAQRYAASRAAQIELGGARFYCVHAAPSDPL